MASSVGSVVFAISADIKDIQGQLRQIEGQFSQTASKVGQIAKGIGTAVGGVFAIGAIKAYVDKIIDLGDQLSDLSDQTGLTVETLGGLRVVTEQNGSSLGAFASGVLKAQKNLGELTDEGKGAALGIQALGLNIAEVRKLSPDQFLETFAAALAKVEDRNLRAAIAARVFGKAGTELIPTILSLAENGVPKLSSETANAYRVLGEFKDQMVVVSAAIADKIAPAIAGLIGLIQQLNGTLSERSKNAFNLDALATQGSQVAAQLKQSQALRAAGSRSGLASDAVFNELTKKRDELLAQISAASAKLATPQVKGNPGKSLNDFAAPKAAGVDKLQTALDGYLKSLQAAIAKEEEQRIKLQFGELASLKAAQAFDVLALKEKLVADGIAIPPQVAADVRSANETLLSLGVNVSQLATKDFPKLRDAYIEAADANQRFVKALEAADAAMKIDSRIVEENAKLKAEALDALRQYNDLIQGVQIGAIKDPEQRRIAGIEVEFAKTAAKIQELGQATGKSQEEIAAAVADAWKKSLNDINYKVDELTQFQIEALARIQDSVASFINDALNGNLKGWRAWADGVRKALNEVTSQILASHLNEFLFGPKPANSNVNQGGGLLGSVFSQAGGLFSGGQIGFGSAPAGVSGPSFANGGFFSSIGQSDILGSITSIFGFANGGRPPVGMPSLVGERGPELFIPDVAGTVVPNGKFGGNQIVFNISTPDAASFVASQHKIYSGAAAALNRANNR